MFILSLSASPNLFIITAKCQTTPYFLMVKNFGLSTQDPQKNPDRHQNLNTFSLEKCPSSV